MIGIDVVDIERFIQSLDRTTGLRERLFTPAEAGDDSILPYADELIPLPRVPVLLQPLVAVVPLQLFACELASVMGHDVDQPRNLAKSVTVE